MLAAALVLALAAPGRAQPGDPGPPDALPPGSVLPVANIVLNDAPLRFSDSHVAAGDASLAAPGAEIVPGALSLREEGRGLRFTLGADLLFDFDRAELRREAGPVLRRLVEEVGRRLPGAEVLYRVEGHTDWIGTDAYNQRLSERRAASVRRWLQQAGGVPAARIAAAGFGESRPVAPNARPDGSDDPEGRQRNRRVEIVVTPR